MLTLQIVLKLFFLLFLFAAAAMAIFKNIRFYRSFATIAVFIVSTVSFLEDGILGLLVILSTIGIVLPIAILVTCRIIVWLTWKIVRLQFPDEPKKLPCERLSLGDVYRLMTNLD